MPGWKGPALEIRPVGLTRGGPGKPVLAFEEGELRIGRDDNPHTPLAQQESEIAVFDEYAECLDGIEDFSHVVVLYWSHLVDESGRAVRKVHPAGQRDLPKVGVFATRSPARPNPLCSTTVELLGREGNVLRVRGLDAVDSSPVIDLKPHHPAFDAPQGVRLAGWMEELMRRFRGEG